MTAAQPVPQEQNPLHVFHQTLTPSGAAVLQQIGRTRKNPGAVRARIDEAAFNAVSRANHGMHELSERMSPEQLRGVLVQDDEKVVHDSDIMYKSMLIREIGAANISYLTSQEWTGSHTRLNGRVVLTDKRLLFMTANAFRWSDLRASQNLAFERTDMGSSTYPTEEVTKAAGRPPGGYLLTSATRDEVWYFPVPLTSVVHVAFELSRGIQESFDIVAEEPGCFGCFCAPFCPKPWNAQSRGGAMVNNRVIFIAVLLPPWNERSLIRIDVDEAVSLVSVRDFVAKLERFSAQLNTSKK
jgi:hypothetical protein